MSWFETIFGFLLTPVLIGAAGWAIQQLTPESQQATAVRAIWPWFAKGFVTPAVLWMLLNFGFSFQFHALMPAVQRAQNTGGNWFPIYLHVIAGGWVVAASAWAAVTVAWRLWESYQRIIPEVRLEFHAVCFTSFAIMILPAGALLYGGGWLSVGFAALLLTLPIIGYGAPLLNRPKAKPMYSRALARMKRGNYSDAEKEILQQLEKAENDFDGWLMLAELHATRFNELAEAEKIILDTCLDANATPSQISVALHKLADWQLQLAADPEAAARTLKLIGDRLPGTHLAHMAELRRAQLPSNAEYKQQREARPIPVPAMPSVIPDPAAPPSAPPAVDVAPAPVSPAPEPLDPLEQINRLSEALTRNPNSISDREQLARLLAEPVGKADLAIEQIELLLGMNAQPDVKRVEWLTLIAGWQLQLLQDENAAAVTLGRIVSGFPGTPQAFAAQRRLNLIKMGNPGNA